ncbi:hypothetical protein BU26DRAFT_606901 [Trematosphaeria pertusa]|uniref:Uncharacterized protein n=1 Tax=Trematosphaeria pertusa TaxID=390896 RepID=A0A6A6I905_9PLEO|nr:uncharacterized protein BU26DRAFT_606901 [Trematosphaeria pertusa]KAF2246699.1 hypothetical protein BU26DRAFT_606901 [Trematosphaeria pertusa]
MAPVAYFPLPPSSSTAATREAISQRHYDPTPTNTVPGELHQIRAYVDAMNTRIGYLEGLLEPSSVDQVTEIKRGLKGTHKGLEKLQTRVSNRSISTAIAEIKRKAWQAYRRLVFFEEYLREMGMPREIQGQGSRQHAVAYASSEASQPRVPEMSWLNDAEEGDEDNEQDTYMSGALPYGTYVQDDAGPLQYPFEAEEDPSDGVITLPNGAYTRPNGIHFDEGVRGGTSVRHYPRLVNHKQRAVHIGCHLTKTRAEVEQSIAEEERFGSFAMNDPDRQREGSVTGFFAAFAILNGIDDPSYYLPKLKFVKIHELRALKGWLVAHKYLRRSGSISRLEKLLHLLFLLQGGGRIESWAVVFSRTPREVQDACNEVFEGLLELHSETLLPQRPHQHVHDGLWGISERYLVNFGNPSTNYGERSYGWKMDDVWKVLATLNLFIGRYRQQGNFALDGPYHAWWVYFQEAGDFRHD